MRSDYMKTVKRIVVKVGSSSLTHDNGLINIHQLEDLVKQLADLHNKGYEVILVSSGAIAAGIGKLNLTSRPTDLFLLQATAAVGQVALIHLYQKLFSEYGIIVAQLLLTKEDLEDEKRLYYTKHVTESLIEKKVIQIVNENDAVAVDEIKFGDNDTLSARVAKYAHADLLILLSDIDGLYTKNPNNFEDAELIEEVKSVASVKHLAGDSHSSVGTGGMITKLEAATIANDSGVHMVIANSKTPWVIKSITEGKGVGTLFVRKE
ncbi:MAG: glutamate 5-kinase [Clostridia bacterium]|nr:glutamate 5-kinase [Clostridia bacterium]